MYATPMVKGWVKAKDSPDNTWAALLRELNPPRLLPERRRRAAITMIIIINKKRRGFSRYSLAVGKARR